jgi:Zn-dependent protease
VFDTYTLGRLFGVPVRVHGLLLVLLTGLLCVGALRGEPVVLPVASVVIALLAHELGHALVARRLGVQVVDIVLGPIVSKAHLVGMPEDAGIEARIAIAGPVVNLVLAGLAWAALGAVYGGEALALERSVDWDSPAALLRVFVLVNLLFGVINLLPAFPMDGGRLLRAGLVASGRSWLAATELAVRVGKFLAVGMLVLGFVRSIVFLAIALFVLLAGARELLTVRLRHGAPLFGGLRGNGPGGAPGGGPAAWLDLAALLRRGAGAATGAPAATDAEPDTSEPSPQRPASEARAPQRPGAEPGSGSGFSDEDIEKLESYRGRLRRGLEEL